MIKADRPGDASSNTAADHLTVIGAALRQLPGHRTETGPAARSLSGSTAPAPPTNLLDWLHTQRLSYSVGFGLTQPLVDQLAALPADHWHSA